MPASPPRTHRDPSAGDPRILAHLLPDERIIAQRFHWRLAADGSRSQYHTALTRGDQEGGVSFGAVIATARGAGLHIDRLCGGVRLGEAAAVLLAAWERAGSVAPLLPIASPTLVGRDPHLLLDPDGPDLVLELPVWEGRGAHSPQAGPQSQQILWECAPGPEEPFAVFTHTVAPMAAPIAHAVRNDAPGRWWRAQVIPATGSASARHSRRHSQAVTHPDTPAPAPPMALAPARAGIDVRRALYGRA